MWPSLDGRRLRPIAGAEAGGAGRRRSGKVRSRKVRKTQIRQPEWNVSRHSDEYQRTREQEERRHGGQPLFSASQLSRFLTAPVDTFSPSHFLAFRLSLLFFRTFPRSPFGSFSHSPFPSAWLD